MTLVSIIDSDPFTDGRQSERALEIGLGVERYFRRMGSVCLPEMTLKSGRRADIVALQPDGKFTIVEIKSSVEDFRSDTKWQDYKSYCDHFYFATLSDVPAEIFPDQVGFLVADKYDCELVRPSQSHPLSAARRKAVLIKFAQDAARRLHKLGELSNASLLTSLDR